MAKSAKSAVHIRGATTPHLDHFCRIAELANVFNTHTHTHPCNGPLSGTSQVSRYQKGKTNLDFIGTVSGSGIGWAICKSTHRSRQITTPVPDHSVFLQAGCTFCRPTNSVKAQKATGRRRHTHTHTHTHRKTTEYQ